MDKKMEQAVKRVADVVIEEVYKKGVDTVFTLTGGGAMFLNDAVALHKEIKVVCNHHEQACAMGAVAYSKAKNNYGAKILEKTGTTSKEIVRDREAQVDSAGAQRTISYNWPHDYYSLVELIKIDAAVEFSKIEKDPTSGARRVVPITAEDSE